MKPQHWAIGLAVAAAGVVPLPAGEFSAGSGDLKNAFDAPVPGFLGPDGTGNPRLQTGVDEDGNPIVENPRNYLNPLFFTWADEIADFQPAGGGEKYRDPDYALGPATGDLFDVVSLGELSAAEISAGDPPGTITVRLTKPVRDLSGADFVVFENALAGSGGQVFGELAFVEVSADGEAFVRFPATSLVPGPVGTYATFDPTLIRNLAGKHVNGNGRSWGTPFDLAETGLEEIRYVRIVDIPGNGHFTDAAGRPIYDPWITFDAGGFSSAGFDLEAVGAISSPVTFAEWPQLANLPPDQRGPADDPDGDGLPNLLEYAFAKLPWLADSTDSVRSARDGDGFKFHFQRDERAADLLLEIQASATMAGWTTLATSAGGGPFVAAAGADIFISETSASSIASVGVIRAVEMRENAAPAGAARFYRIKASQQP